MAIVTYRSVHMHNGGIVYACQDALDTSGYNAEPGPPMPDAPMFLCEECSEELERDPNQQIERRDTEP